jgi:acetyl esterase/lipase
MALGKKILRQLSKDSQADLVATETYGPHPRQVYDLYAPAHDTTKNRLTIIFLYGGYWRSGSRTDYGYVAKSFVKLGYSVIIPDYRLYPEVRHPSFIEDVARAINHYQAKYHSDRPSRLVFLAHSAGAQIGALISYSKKYQKLLDSPQSVTGFIGLAGAYGFIRNSAILRGVFPETDKSDWQPIAAADTFTVPALLLGAKYDLTVAPKSTIDMANLLAGHDAKVSVHQFILAQHPTLVLDLRARNVVPTAVMGHVKPFLRDIASGK